MVRQLEILPLGGLGQIGMNCLCVEYGDSRLIIDTGLTFPDHALGSEIIHPDFAYLRDNDCEHEAIVLTHGHEDHVGALPFLLADIDAPVYGPGYALAMAKERLGEYPPKTPPSLTTTLPGQRFSVGEFEVEPFRVSHSIPDCTGLIIRCGGGTIVHTGDFRIDRDPPDGEALDEEALAQVGQEGVRLLLSDSTNIEREEVLGSERAVARQLGLRIAEAEGRVVVSMFASNIYRMQALVDAAAQTGRKLALIGRSIETHSRVASELGHLRGLDAVQIDRKAIADLPRHQVLVGATGSQGEMRAALQRIARGTHPSLSLSRGDLVIHSARIIPGKEREVYSTFDALARAGVKVIHKGDDPAIHVSGHAPRCDQRRMIELTRPRGFCPVHGTRHHMERHAALAREMGVEDVAIVDNGNRLTVGSKQLEIGVSEAAGQIHLQAGQEIDGIVLRDRRVLAEAGICLITVTLKSDGTVLARPKVLTRGVMREDDESDLLNELIEIVENSLTELRSETKDSVVVQAVCRPVRKRLRNEFGFKPPVHCLLTRVP